MSPVCFWVLLSLNTSWNSSHGDSNETWTSTNSFMATSQQQQIAKIALMGECSHHILIKQTNKQTFGNKTIPGAFRGINPGVLNCTMRAPTRPFSIAQMVSFTALWWWWWWWTYFGSTPGRHLYRSARILSGSADTQRHGSKVMMIIII